MSWPVSPTPVGDEAIPGTVTGTRRAPRVFRSIGAVIAGALTGIILSIGTDAALVAAAVFPPLTEPDQFTTPLLLLATLYRNIYGVAGSYLTARLAPRNPMGHALVLGRDGSRRQHRRCRNHVGLWACMVSPRAHRTGNAVCLGGWQTPRDAGRQITR